MIETIYTKLPFDKISYLDRPEFHSNEKEFKKALTESMTKYGMKDPVYCWANGKAYGDIIKVVVGNNRMTVAKALGIKMIPAVITNFKADTLPIEGQVLKTDAEIRELFHLPKDLGIRRDKNGNVDQVMPVYYMKEGVREEYV
mgnify:FL=1|jgi:hypothetical protein|tara:strand:- start:287 stop:715 length:429 start_codon:yes stop_codon:yes gene_type:complete